MTLRALRAESAGFTLVELLAAMASAVAVMLGAFTIVDNIGGSSKTIDERQDAVTRGRQAIDEMTRLIRSSVCLQTNPAAVPIVSGTGTQMSFYAYLGDPTTATTTTSRDATSGQPFPTKYTLTYSGTSTQPGTITEAAAAVTKFSPLTFGSTTTRTLATNVLAPSGSLFQYYGPDTTGSSAASTTAMTPPLTTTTAPSVVQVGIAFRALPTGSTSTSDPQASTLQSQVLWRAIDPENPSDQPCDNG